ncbi:MAG: hypothetical protein Q7R62_01660 [bacterium]|nr:hypothetical protein [bacterium]
MKIKNTIMALAGLAIMASPVMAFASTYQFVDSSGRLQSVIASNPTEAFATARNIGFSSGVMLVSAGNTGVVLGSYYDATASGNNNYYQFVDISGNLRGVWASNPTEAFALAQKIGIHSGVMLVDTK